MSVIEQFSTISTTITHLLDFLTNSPVVKEDVEEYLKTISASGVQSKKLQALLLPYLFERMIDKKSIFQIYTENTDIKDEEERKIVKSLESTFESVFEIKKIQRNGFIFYNLVNDTEYEVLPLVKMTAFRELINGQFVLARIFEHENTYYLIEISAVMPGYKKEDAYQYALAKLLEQPELLYNNNPQKQAEIEEQIKYFSERFEELFGTDEIITDNKHVDNLLDLFNNYSEEPDNSLKEEAKNSLYEPEKYGYFPVKELSNKDSNFLENSMGGFSAHSSTYDVGMIFDKETGLYIIPFWGTLVKGLQTDYKQIENFAQCMRSILENDKIPDTILKKLNNSYPNFIQVVNEIMESNYTFDALLQHYKQDFLTKKIYSPTTVLYASDLFTKSVALLNQKEIESQKQQICGTKKVAPNAPCPCGSGKKYKKCCGAN